MKTRSGFVSSSSSTSFTIIVTPEIFTFVRQLVSETARKLMDEAWSNPAVFKVGDVTLWDLSYIDHDGEYWQEMGCYLTPEKEVDDDEQRIDREKAYDLGQEIIAKLKEKGAYIREECC